VKLTSLIKISSWRIRCQRMTTLVDLVVNVFEFNKLDEDRLLKSLLLVSVGSCENDTIQSKDREFDEFDGDELWTSALLKCDDS